MGKLIGDADQICGYGFSSTYLGTKASQGGSLLLCPRIPLIVQFVRIKFTKGSKGLL